MSISNRKLRVFLSCSSPDRAIARELYEKLKTKDWVAPWLDAMELFPGQDWDMEIRKAIREADAVVAILSGHTVNKEGYVQRELMLALDIAHEKPLGSIYLIPARVDNCEMPKPLRKLQWVDLFDNASFELLLQSLKQRARVLGLKHKELKPSPDIFSAKRPLMVFLGHASEDKIVVKDLCKKLRNANQIEPWLDVENLLPGQDWDMEVQRAIENADAIVVCFSRNSVSKEGYIKKELQYILDAAKTRAKNFVISLRLSECDVPLEFGVEYIDYFSPHSKQRCLELLLAKLEIRAKVLGLGLTFEKSKKEELKPAKAIVDLGLSPSMKNKSVFISYSQKDIEFVKKLDNDLRLYGANPWWDVGKLKGGDAWMSSIQVALDQSEYCVVIVTPDSLKSHWVEREYIYAINNKIKVIPLYLKTVDKMPFVFSTIQHIDFRDNHYKSAIKKLCAAMRLMK